MPYLAGLTRLADMAKLDLHAILRGLLPWALAARLDRELPTHLDLPTGRAAIDYTQITAAGLGEGHRRSTAWRRRLCWRGGQVPLRLALLSRRGDQSR